jgi:hypothetical protein
MTDAIDKPQPGSAQQDVISRLSSQVADFGEGIFHGAVENPYNGLVELVNHSTEKMLPELHLVDQEKIDHSLAGQLGTMVGIAVDFAALSAATGGLGATTALGSALEMGAVGGAYGAVFQPSDAKSANFWRERVTNGAIGAATFAGMGAANALLDATGKLAVPAARSLAGTIGSGALVGAGGGIAHAEAKAVLKDGKVVPTFKDLTSDVENYAAFGAAFGAGGYALSRLFSPPEHFELHRSGGTKNYDIYSDAQGNPVRMELEVPYDMSVRTDFLHSVKMPDGSWSTKQWSNADPEPLPYEVLSVTRSAKGSILEKWLDPSDGSVYKNRLK